MILAIDGTDVRSAVEVEQAIRRHKPGDELAIVFERRGQRATDGFASRPTRRSRSSALRARVAACRPSSAGRATNG